ncbi:MAG: hypothetical protein ABIH99_03265 [Candidatus Micrarchaeota archaeon]
MGSYTSETTQQELENINKANQTYALELSMASEGLEELYKLVQAVNPSLSSSPPADQSVRSVLLLLAYSNLYSLKKCKDLIYAGAVFEADILMRSILERIDLMQVFHGSRDAELINSFMQTKYLLPADEQQRSEHFEFEYKKWRNNFSPSKISQHLKKLNLTPIFRPELYKYLSLSSHVSSAQLLKTYSTTLQLKESSTASQVGQWDMSFSHKPAYRPNHVRGSFGRLCMLAATTIWILESEFKISPKRAVSPIYHAKVEKHFFPSSFKKRQMLNKK